MKNIVIFDLDGTLALIEHRRHLVEKKAAFDKWMHTLPEEGLQEIMNSLDEAAAIEKFVKEQSWKPDWDAFYEACDKDEPNTTVIEMFTLLAYSLTPKRSLGYFELIILSGRSEVVRARTEKWLKDNDIYLMSYQSPKLYMRPDKDYTPDDQLKAKWLEEIGGPERVFCVFDDRKKVVDMWRSKGITCFQVAPGNF